MNKNMAKFRIVNILKNHVLNDITINDFKILTDTLELDLITLKVRNAIIKEKEEESRKIQADSEWKLLESMEEN